MCTFSPQVAQHLTNSLEVLLGAAFSQQSQGGTSLEMISILLQIGRPHHFEGFEAFTKWRASFAATVSQSLILGAAGKILVHFACLGLHDYERSPHRQ